MLHTLDSLKKNNKDSKKGDKDTTSYTGGEKSGLAVENPEDIHGILSKAEKSTKGKDGEQTKTNCKIILYQNGFIVNDGEFRDYNKPENKAFMQELNQQQVPTELKNKFPNGLYVGLEDKSSEKYRLPTPPKYVAFSG